MSKKQNCELNTRKKRTKPKNSNHKLAFFPLFFSVLHHFEKKYVETIMADFLNIQSRHCKYLIIEIDNICFFIVPIIKSCGLCDPDMQNLNSFEDERQHCDYWFQVTLVTEKT